MARKRMIDPNIWQSEDFNKLDTFSRLVFIGLFSLADDEGRGRANPTYIKSSIFPYDEVVRTTDIEKSLSKISASMSIVFYEHNESKYYELLNWDKWQKIDRPTESKIPEYIENEMKTIFDEYSTNVRRVISLNKNKKENKNIKEREKPTLDEIQNYVSEKNLNVDAKQFYDYFEAGNWIDSKGNKVRNWKQKILTWSKYSVSQKQENKTKDNFSQRNYDNMNKFYSN